MGLQSFFHVNCSEFSPFGRQEDMRCLSLMGIVLLRIYVLSSQYKGFQFLSKSFINSEGKLPVPGILFFIDLRAQLILLLRGSLLG